MQPFQGIRVLDLTHVLAGPFATYQLAVLGADVIKIEPPDRPDMVREEGPVTAYNRARMGTHFLAQNSNKRAVTLNLKSETGRAILKQLTESADVFVENYRTGALASLGLGYEDLSQINPRLIYCSITGFGQKGPYAGRTAYDNVIQAMSGLMSTTGTKEVAPLKVGAPIVDYGTGAQAAFAIAGALFQRTRTDRGQHIDVAMLDAAVMLMTMNVANYLIGGVDAAPRGNRDSENAGYSCYETKDGLLMLGAYTGKQQARLWRLLGRDDIAEDVEACSFDDLRSRGRRHARLLETIFATRTAEEWERLLAEAQVPAARVRGLAESLAERHLRVRGTLHAHPSPAGFDRGISVPVAAFTYAHDGPAVKTPPPRHGEHTREVLEQLGFSPGELDRLRAEGTI
ncbi:MAG TPA: CoA transferase [Alphaproteobacteria bacterium]|nr:CoA transferase [Alphaproteobacteria bacterium]